MDIATQLATLASGTDAASQFFLGMGEASWTSQEATDLPYYGAPALSVTGWIGDAVQ